MIGSVQNNGLQELIGIVITVRNEVTKVMFLQACLSTGGVSALGGCLLQGGVCSWGCLLWGGVCSQGVPALH